MKKQPTLPVKDLGSGFPPLNVKTVTCPYCGGIAIVAGTVCQCSTCKKVFQYSGGGK